MASNPNPARITGATWRLWEESHDAIGGIQLGGIWANKPGYHGTRDSNDRDDYSVQYTADRDGPDDKSAGLDLTFPEAHRGDYRRIKQVTGRLIAAARDRDPRIYRGSTPVIREVIGNVGGRARAYDLYRRGEDSRDDSHLWHIHLSITRRYVTDWSVLSGLVSIMAGDDDMELNDKVRLSEWIRDNFDGMDSTISVETALGSTYGHARSTKEYVLRLERESRLRDEAILSAIKGVDTAAILAAINARAAEDAARDAALTALVEGFADGTLNAEQVATRVVDLMGERLGG